MSSEWDRPGRVDLVIADMEALALALRVGSWEPSNLQSWRLMFGAVRLAGALVNTGLPPEPAP